MSDTHCINDVTGRFKFPLSLGYHTQSSETVPTPRLVNTFVTREGERLTVLFEGPVAESVDRLADVADTVTLRGTPNKDGRYVVTAFDVVGGVNDHDQSLAETADVQQIVPLDTSSATGQRHEQPHHSEPTVTPQPTTATPVNETAATSPLPTPDQLAREQQPREQQPGEQQHVQRPGERRLVAPLRTVTTAAPLRTHLRVVNPDNGAIEI